MVMLIAVAAEYSEITIPQFTSDFWIYHFEIVFDLSKRLSPGAEDSDRVTPAELGGTVEQKDDKGGGVNINCFPTEMLSRIFSYCAATDLLAVQAVCPRWQEIVHSDRSLWNHVTFSARDLDVKTTASLLREMPLLRSVDLCNIHSSEDMTFLISVLCEASWQLTHVHFPETCEWHPSPHNLHQLNYYHPRISSLQLCTKQKLLPADISGIGAELAEFPFLKHLTLIGFYWHQPELIPELLSLTESLKSLSLPSVPGLSGAELSELSKVQPGLTKLTINTSSISGRHLSFKKFPNLKDLKIIDNSTLTGEKVKALRCCPLITSLNFDLHNCNKEEIMNFFSTPNVSLTGLTVNNCAFSDALLMIIVVSCRLLRVVTWHNPKDSAGEISDIGLEAITRLPTLQSLDVKSKSVTKAHYAALAAMRSLKYVRINGMKVPGCL